jgi:colanic acid biosynthesis glycosyl transferase WcaI
MPNRARQIVFAEQFYFPDGWGGAQIPRDITTHLAKAGLNVSVVCGSDPYAPVQGDCGPDPTLSGVRIVRLPRLFGGDIHSFKLLRQLWFYLLAAPALLLRRRPDVLVAQTNPPILVPLVALVARLRNVPFMIIAQDLYPEVVIAHGMLRADSLAARFLRTLFGWAYRHARIVVAPGPVMAERLQEKGVAPERIVVISNWATGEEGVVKGAANLLRPRWKLEGKFVLLYSGNLGIAHEFDTVVLALERAIERRPELRLVIVGKGSRLAEVRELVRQRGLEQFVLFENLVPADMLPHSIGLADLALVTLRNSFEGLVVPSKLLGYMARGIPTVYVGPRSDVSAMLQESRGGQSFPSGAIDLLADELVKLAGNPAALESMGEAARSYYDTHLSRDVAVARYAELVKHAVHATKRTSDEARP